MPHKRKNHEMVEGSGAGVAASTSPAPISVPVRALPGSPGSSLTPKTPKTPSVQLYLASTPNITISRQPAQASLPLQCPWGSPGWGAAYNPSPPSSPTNLSLQMAMLMNQAGSGPSSPRAGATPAPAQGFGLPTVAVNSGEPQRLVQLPAGSRLILGNLTIEAVGAPMPPPPPVVAASAPSIPTPAEPFPVSSGPFCTAPAASKALPPKVGSEASGGGGGGSGAGFEDFGIAGEGRLPTFARLDTADVGALLDDFERNPSLLGQIPTGSGLALSGSDQGRASGGLLPMEVADSIKLQDVFGPD